MNLLIVEDDIPLANAIKRVLERNKFKVDIVSDGEEALGFLMKNDYSLYLLDINLPNFNGHQLLKIIKNKNKNSIVVMITASAEIEDIEKAYGYGCDDYLKKPFHAKELLIRINKLLKENRKEIVVDNIVFFPDTMDLFIDEKPVELRKKEKRLLYILLKNLNKTVSKEEIINFVWEGEKKENYPLRQLISSLKSKLNKYVNKEYIISVVGVGYKFVKA